MRDYFQILGVPHTAGAAAIREASRRLSRRYHPDISGDCAATGDERGETGDVRRDYGRGDMPGDEIAIDFPSVGGLVDRMRESFFADASARWSAHIELTRGEARDGARVPIDVPHAETCVECGGRGEILADGCAACGGCGTRPGAHRVRLVLPPGVSHGEQLMYHLRMPAGAPAMLSVSVAIDQARA